jgi:RNase P subunit RPR2
VPIIKGVCSGCHIILPPQFVNEVRIGKEIRFCPECSRILYFKPDEEGEEDITAIPFNLEEDYYEEGMDEDDEEEEDSYSEEADEE